MSTSLFKAAFPFQKDVLALPVTDLDVAATWYSEAFGLSEVERRPSPHPTVILARDGVQIGFAINGGGSFYSRTLREGISAGASLTVGGSVLLQAYYNAINKYYVAVVFGI